MPKRYVPSGRPPTDLTPAHHPHPPSSFPFCPRLPLPTIHLLCLFHPTPIHTPSLAWPAPSSRCFWLLLLFLACSSDGLFLVLFTPSKQTLLLFPLTYDLAPRLRRQKSENPAFSSVLISLLSPTHRLCVCLGYRLSPRVDLTHLNVSRLGPPSSSSSFR